MNRVINFNKKLKYLLKEAERDYIKELLIKSYLEKKFRDEDFEKRLVYKLSKVKKEFSEDELLNFLNKKFRDVSDSYSIIGNNLLFRGYFNLPNFEDFVKVLCDEFSCSSGEVIKKLGGNRKNFWKEIIDGVYIRDDLDAMDLFDKVFYDFRPLYDFFDRLSNLFYHFEIYERDIYWEVSLEFVDEKVGIVSFSMKMSYWCKKVFPYVYDIDCLKKELFNISMDKNEWEIFSSNFISFIFKKFYDYYKNFPSGYARTDLEEAFLEYYIPREIKTNNEKRYKKCNKIIGKHFDFWKKFTDKFKYFKKKLSEPLFLFKLVCLEDEKVKKIKKIIKSDE